MGHLDFDYLRFQVLDTPGVLDHPIEEMTTIEMQSVVALAHLRACILYFMDLSESCGYSVAAQVSLCKSLKPLFAGKPTFIVINKMDMMKPDDLDPESKAELDGLLKSGDYELLTVSCSTQEGVQQVKNGEDLS